MGCSEANCISKGARGASTAGATRAPSRLATPDPVCAVAIRVAKAMAACWDHAQGCARMQ